MKMVKSIFLAGTVMGLLLFAGACNNGNQNDRDDIEQNETNDRVNQNNSGETSAMHQQHKSLKENFAHQDIILLENPYNPEKAAVESLKQVIVAYLEMKDAFVQGNVAEVNDAANSMVDKVSAVDKHRFTGKGEEAWQQHSSLYLGKLKELQHSSSLEAKRSYFSHLSEIAYCTVKSFDLKGDMELFATFCPMAFDGKGAYWLSESETIRNPYFGEQMLNCGEVKENL